MLALKKLTQLLLLLTMVSSFIGVSNVQAVTMLNPQSVISRNVPAYTNRNAYYPASSANDNNYYGAWIGNAVPAYVAYDLSGVPTAQRGQVVLVWYNDPATKPFNPTLIGDQYYDTPQEYTIEVNAAAGGSYPSSGWQTLVTVSGNQYTSRQHLIDMTGYNWVRMNISSCLTYFAGECGINMDVQDASKGVSDDWIFYGDSITSIAFDHDPLTADGGTGTFSQLINAGNTDYFPVQQNGGIGGWATADPLAGSPSYFSTWLSLFPGNFVALNYGTNDANNNSTTGGSPDLTAVNTFYNNMKTMVQAIIAAGKTPAIGKIPWGNTANIQANGPAMNSKIDQLYLDFPEIIPGPDLWTYFYNNQSQISGDNVHPNNLGFYAIRQQWANTVLSNVYTAPTVSATPVGGSFNSSQSVTLTAPADGTIYFTTNGTTPTVNSTKYSSPISVTSTKTLKFISVNKGLNQSTVKTETYTINTPTPTALPIATATPTVAANSSGNSTSNSTSTEPVCTKQSPGSKIPNMYGAIAHSSSTVEIFFTDADKPVDHYVLAYGLSSADYQFGIDSFGEVGKGQQSYEVKGLQPNTTYFFKVRAGNGCASGSWSNEISVKTKPFLTTKLLDITSSSLEPVKKQSVDVKDGASQSEDKNVEKPTTAAADGNKSNLYNLNVTVKDKKNKPVEGAAVTLHSQVQTAISDKNGVAHFSNVESGDHKLLIAYNNFRGEQTLNISGGQTDYNLNVTVEPNNILLTPQVLSLVGILVLVISVFTVQARRKNLK